MKQATLLLIVFLCIYSRIAAQEEQIDYTRPESFEIGAIKVKGAVHSDEAAIIAISGLEIGQRISIPGPEITHAMKALWKMKLYADIEINKVKTIGDAVFLEIVVEERARIAGFSLKGVKKNNKEDLEKELTRHLIKGTILTENAIEHARRSLKEFYADKGYPNAVINIHQQKDSAQQNAVHLIFEVDKRAKVKILKISFAGNDHISSKKLRKLMQNTQERKRLLKKSILTDDGFATDKKSLIAHYNRNGYRDAQIVSDSIWQSEEGDLNILITVNEGYPYYFRNISWKGNRVYSSFVLESILNIKKGDIYNEERLEERLRFSMESADISSLYMDNGHLFFQVDYEESLVGKDSIDLKITINEGPVARIDKIIIKGNTVTSEEVIRREIRTKPGDPFSRAAIIRSQRELINMGYFNPETIQVSTPVDAQNGTVDIVYTVEERASDQFELSAGWDPASKRLLGSAGVSLNNVSIKNLFNKAAWSPFPRGDGQSLSLRLQSTGKAYQSYNLSFTEPWLGGKKPTNLTVAGFYTKRFYEDSEGSDQRFNVLGGTVNLSSRLQWPDDNFVSSTALNVQKINLQNWKVDGFVLEDGSYLSDGTFYNINLKQTIARSTLNHPIFPSKGSKMSLSLQVTPPYSLFRKGDSGDGKSSQDKFKWLEYYKTRFDGEWYTPLSKSGKLVLKTTARMGIVGAYNKEIGLSPFERYYFGGDGFSTQQGFTGVDLISLRGYDDQLDFPVNQNGGATSFAKFSTELRYLVSGNPNATIYLLGFAEAGNAWANIKDFNPFDMKTSAGLGLRVHLPMFGTLGLDYGIGFNKDPVGTGNFLSRFGKISLILGLEPD